MFPDFSTWTCQPLPAQVAKPSPCHLCLTHIHSFRLKLPATHPIMPATHPHHDLGLMEWSCKNLKALQMLESYSQPQPPVLLPPPTSNSLHSFFIVCQPRKEHRTRSAFQQALSVQECTSYVSWGNSTSDAVCYSEGHTSIDLQNFHFPCPPRT